MYVTGSTWMCIFDYIFYAIGFDLFLLFSVWCSMLNSVNCTTVIMDFFNSLLSLLNGTS